MRAKPGRTRTLQVLRLCDAHGLHSAMAYVHNCLLEYGKPVLDMLWAVVGGGRRGGAARLANSHSSGNIDGAVAQAGPRGSGSSSIGASWVGGGAAQSREGLGVGVGYKLLVYLRCLLNGQAFPPGAPGVAAFGAFAAHASLLPYGPCSALVSLPCSTCL